MKVIIFGNNLQNTLGLVRSVGMKGYEVILLLEPIKKSNCYVRHSKYISKIHYLNSLQEGIDVLLREYGNELEKPVVLCGSDPTICMLDAHYEQLKDKFHIFNAGEQGRINLFEDKLNQFKIAEQCGIRTIRTWHISDITKLPSDIPCPCLVKGNNSVTSTKGDLFICHSKEELTHSLKEGIDYLVQEYIEKDYELNINGFSYNHGNNVFIPAGIHKLRDGLYEQGLFMRLDSIEEFPELDVEKLKLFIKKIGYEGIFSIEFLCKDNAYYLLEINMRNDGCGWLYTSGGINYPYLWIKYCEGNLTQNFLDGLKLINHTYLMHENDMYNLVRGKVSLWQWINDFQKTKAFYIANSKDPMPFIVSTWIHVRQFGKMILRKCFHLNIK